jgi:hypothetical protein
MRARHLILGIIGGLALVHPVKSQVIVNEFPSPSGEPRGLAWGRNHIWVADSEVDSIYKCNPVDGEILSSFHFSIPSSYGGLTWSQDDNLWIAMGSYVYKLNPTTGEELTGFHCPGG